MAGRMPPIDRTYEPALHSASTWLRRVVQAAAYNDFSLSANGLQLVCMLLLVCRAVSEYCSITAGAVLSLALRHAAPHSGPL
jgi:hypothetical protein